MVSLVTNDIDKQYHFPTVNWTAPQSDMEDICLNFNITNTTLSRHKRGVYDFMGKVVKFLLGLSTEDDVAC